MKIRKEVDPELYFEQQNARSGIVASQTFATPVLMDLMLGDINIDENSEILDIGCRAGIFVHDMHRTGFTKICGMDIGEKAESRWENFPKDLRSNMTRQDIHDGIPFDKKFVLIVASHVLEHVHDIDAVIDILKEGLNEGGTLYIKLPLDYVTMGMDHKSHYTFFESFDDIEKYFESKGFEVTHITETKLGPDPEHTFTCKLK